MNDNIKEKWLNEWTYKCFLNSENETETSLHDESNMQNEVTETENQSEKLRRENS